MNELDREQEAKAIELAESRGRRQQVVDSRLNQHEDRLNSINGNIARGNQNISELSRKIDSLANKIDIAGKVGHALTKQATDAINKQVSRREFWLGVATVVAVLAASILKGVVT